MSVFKDYAAFKNSEIFPSFIYFYEVDSINTMKKLLSQTKRIIIIVFGVTIVLIGLALIVLPGPGLIVIIFGLAILASEFVWAERLLQHAKNHYDKASNHVKKKLQKSNNT